MKPFAPLCLAACLLLAGPVHVQAQGPAQNLADTRATEAQAAATVWLASFDAGTGEDNWLQSASLFKERVSQDSWTQNVASMHQRLGPLKSRTLKGMGFTTHLENAPDGEYFVMRYLSTYAKQDNVVEILVPMRDRDGNWKIANYVAQ